MSLFFLHFSVAVLTQNPEKETLYPGADCAVKNTYLERDQLRKKNYLKHRLGGKG